MCALQLRRVALNVRKESFLLCLLLWRILFFSWTIVLGWESDWNSSRCRVGFMFNVFDSLVFITHVYFWRYNPGGGHSIVIFDISIVEKCCY